MTYLCRYAFVIWIVVLAALLAGCCADPLDYDIFADGERDYGEWVSERALVPIKDKHDWREDGDLEPHKFFPPRLTGPGTAYGADAGQPQLGGESRRMPGPPRVASQVADSSQDAAAFDEAQPMPEARRLLWTDTAFNFLEAHEKARARDARLMVEAMERGEFEALSEVRLRQMLSNHAQAMVYLTRLREAMED